MDVIKISILPDGTIKSETDPISGPNHQNAEGFLSTIAKQAGGKVTRERKGSGHHTHSHEHGHEHTH
jgi:hypothetical protein